ncbi:MAG: hypothetical protein MZU91_00400 [Desulfosudis oleivorans]|nr:hypothetical protein [Desulfosudis oleivorans]
MAADELGQLEQSYKDKVVHWKHGGIVGVIGLRRRRHRPVLRTCPRSSRTWRSSTPSVSTSPSGWFYTTEALQDHLRSSGRSTAAASPTCTAPPATSSSSAPRPRSSSRSSPSSPQAGFDLGGSGSGLRTPSCCVGPARCEWACIDTLDLCLRPDPGRSRTSSTARPSPTSSRSRSSGCPNDCVAAIARADCSIIGTWKDDIRIDQDAVKEYASERTGHPEVASSDSVPDRAA